MWVGLLAIFSAVLAALAYRAARRAGRRLEQLNHAYWELRYQYGELRAQVNRLDPRAAREPAEDRPSPGDATESFIPLSSLKR